jgi:hypothetical protein
MNKNLLNISDFFRSSHKPHRTAIYYCYKICRTPQTVETVTVLLCTPVTI